MGLPHSEHARIPISARLYSGISVDGMMLALDQAGAQYSQSPVTADKGTVMSQHALLGSIVCAHYCSLVGIFSNVHK